MITWFIRQGKRTTVFLLGVTFVYLAIWKFFPFFDNRVPLALALLTTYVFTAYFFIPAVIRFIRLFLRPNHIPLYCITPDGFASDPINIGIVGTRAEIIKAMTKAGWHSADKHTLRNILKLGMSFFFRRPYPTAPFSTLYLFGRKQDLGFQLPVEASVSNRHHVRLWACHLDGPEAFHEHVHFWRRFHRPFKTDDNRQLWVGAACRDVGIVPIRHNAQFTHMVDPDTNAERDLIINSLKKSRKVAKIRTVRVGAPYELRNRTIGGLLRADGRMRICILKD